MSSGVPGKCELCMCAHLAVVAQRTSAGVIRMFVSVLFIVIPNCKIPRCYQK